MQLTGNDQSTLLTADQMQQVDQNAANMGVNTFGLMKEAGKAIANHILNDHPSINSALILAGGGNNGGDGYIAAELLRQTGISTTVACLNAKPETGSDAAHARAYYQGHSLLLQAEQWDTQIADLFKHCDLIIDALFGAGLKRDVTGLPAQLINKTNQTAVPVVAVDLPSGLDGNDHTVKGIAIQATSTVSFFLAKPAHYLYPGKALCGQLVLKQIGLSDMHRDRHTIDCDKNDRKLFQSQLPTLNPTAHKYQRGHVLVKSGPITSTGAARLCANTALTCGTGAVTVASNDSALAVNASHLTAVMLTRCNDAQEWADSLKTKKINTAVIGPGNGLNDETRECVQQSLQSVITTILDADALSCWQAQPADMISALQNSSAETLLTPHSGEFERLFMHTDILKLPSKLHQAKAAAELTNSIVVFKGSDTVIAAPNGRTVINDNAPPWLATAGSGDVLAGAIAALHAQGMPLFEAAAAGVWLHGQAAQQLGYPMTAEQLSQQIGKALHQLMR